MLLVEFLLVEKEDYSLAEKVNSIGWEFVYQRGRLQFGWEGEDDDNVKLDFGFAERIFRGRRNKFGEGKKNKLKLYVCLLLLRITTGMLN